MNRAEEIKNINTIFKRTLELISLYNVNGLSVPFALKGNLGEFIIQMELLKRFPKRKINHHGGAFPGVDIGLDNVKIQVKTQIKHPPKVFKNGSFDFESSPTIKKSILDSGKIDILILIILYPNEDFTKIKKKNIYVFGKSDFKYFNTKFCWSGKSKGDYTIVNVLNVEGAPPKKLKETIDHYNTKEYKALFDKSKDNWEKLENILQSYKPR